VSLYVTDASVVVKWFVPEVHSAAALRVLDGGHELVAPDLLLPEVGNALWKKARKGEITAGQARQILRALDVSPVRIEPSGTVLEVAFEIASALGRSVYDGLYVALAVVHSGLLVTADRKLYNAVHGGLLSDYLLWVEAVS
jgi:predicted nucleic acid-binding protein